MQSPEVSQALVQLANQLGDADPGAARSTGHRRHPLEG